MSKEAQKVALPAFLRKRLQAFRAGQGSEQSYVLVDPATNHTYKMEPWQFFVLEVLPGCEDFPKLASVFEDRFGQPLKREEFDKFITAVAENKLFGLAAVSHSLLAGQLKGRLFRQGRPEGNSGEPASQDPVSGAGIEIKKGSLDAGDMDEASLQAGIQDALGLDERVQRKSWKLFDPRPLLKRVQPWLLPLRHLVYLLPLMAIVAGYFSIRHSGPIGEEMDHLFSDVTIIGHVLFSMVTVNLAATLTTAVVAYTYRATVSGISIVLVLSFFPRFMANIGHVKQLSRRERMWLHAAPLLARIGIFSIGIFLWYGSKGTGGALSEFGLALALICMVSFVFSANPLIKSSGYHLLAAFLNEPHLRGKSYKALFNKLRGQEYKEADSNILVAYALVSTLFTLAVMVVALLILGSFLKVQMGGAGVILVGLLGIYLLRRVILKFRKIEQAYERSVQFERWRKRTFPQGEEESTESSKQSKSKTYLKQALAISFVAALFLPYHYEPGGSFVILPKVQQVITTESASIIKEVYFDGGEKLEEGTVIARLSYSEDQAQLNIYTAKVEEQKAVVEELKSLPKPEEVKLAKQTLEVEITRSRFSKTKLSRYKKLYKEGAVTYEEYDKVRREHKVNMSQVAQKQANLDLIKAGATPNEITAAEAKLQSYIEQKDYYKEKVERSYLYMPFDGEIVSLHLKQKIGSFLDKGDEFAVVESTGQMLAEIEVPEPDIIFIQESSGVRVRPWSYSDEGFTGVVTQVGKDVTEKKFGKFVKVVTLLENEDGRLKKGMTGYAKIDGGTRPVWEVLSMAIVRFFEVEVWSWFP